jgi:membrane-associated phospholipid phosphatase
MPRVVLIFFCLFLAASPALSAQESGVIDTVPTSEQIPAITLPEKNFVHDFLSEQRKIWASPLKIKRGDVKWLLPLSAGAVAFLATDKKVADAATEADNLRPASRVLSKFGGGAPLGIASASMFAIGKVTRNERAAETGRLAGEAVLQSQLAVQALKMMFNRERPNRVGGSSGFWDGGKSFPSGHAATSFAFATVVANKYKDKKLVVFGAYGLATAVSMSRIGGLNHHPSDVLIGAAIGHLIGRFILHRHPADN